MAELHSSVVELFLGVAGLSLGVAELFFAVAELFLSVAEVFLGVAEVFLTRAEFPAEWAAGSVGRAASLGERLVVRLETTAGRGFAPSPGR